MRGGRLAAAVALLSLTPIILPAQQDTIPRDSLPAYLLEGVTVTGRRTPALRYDIPQKVEVVTRHDLERTVGSDIADALTENVGVDVIQYPGLLSGVAMRGFRPQFSRINARTLVLLDGRPAGATNLATLDLSAVERIEVLKGPASALYGANAMSGVVNLVTRSSRGPLHGRASAAYGSFGSYRGEATAGGSLTPALDFDLTLAAAGRRDGYEIGGNRFLAGDSVTKRLLDGRTVRVPEVSLDSALAFSEYATRSGTLRLGYALGERWRLDARGGLFVGDDVQNPGDLNVTAYSTRTLNDLERYTGELGASGELGRHSLLVRGFLSRETTGYYDDALNPTYVSFRSPIRWHGAQLQDVIALGEHTLTVGLDHSAARESSERFTEPGVLGAIYSPNSAIRSSAAFAEGRLSLLGDRLVATLGGRLDRVAFEVEEAELFDASRVTPNIEAHTVLNPSAGLLYRLGEGVRLHGSAGRAFVTPDAFTVAGYSERTAGSRAVRIARGNPGLDPESSTSWDAGASLFRPRQGLEADLTYFHTDVRDRITAQTSLPAGVQLTAAGDTIREITTYRNADRAEIRGVEGRIAYDLGARSGYSRSLRLFASGTRILRAEETTAGVTGDIRNVATLTVVYGVEYDDLRRFGARLSGRYVGERLDSDFSDWQNPGDIRYPEFMVLDAVAHLRLGDRYRLGLLAGNLTDENYYEVRGFNLPGRSVQLQLGVSF